MSGPPSDWATVRTELSSAWMRRGRVERVFFCFMLLFCSSSEESVSTDSLVSQLGLLGFPPTVVRCLLHGHQAALPEEAGGSRGGPGLLLPGDHRTSRGQSQGRFAPSLEAVSVLFIT